MDFWTSVQPYVHIVLAAGAGALVSLRAIHKAPVKEKVAVAFLGFLVGLFGGPALAEWAGVKSLRTETGVVFVCGAAGLVSLSAVVDGIKQVPWAKVMTDFANGVANFGRRKDD